MRDLVAAQGLGLLQDAFGDDRVERFERVLDVLVGLGLSHGAWLVQDIGEDLLKSPNVVHAFFYVPLGF